MDYAAAHYRVYWSLDEFGCQPSDIFRFCVGDHSSPWMALRSKAEAYVWEDGLIPFNTVLHRAIPGFSWYGDWRVSRDAVHDLWFEIYQFGHRVGNAATVTQLRDVVFDVRDLNVETLTTRREQLLQMAAGLRRVTERAISRGTTLWIISP